jgi:alpha-ketoglutarate-dependent taurine dioxygenase
MSPSRISPEPTLQVQPFVPKTPKQKTNFGAFVTGIDINDISEADVEELKKTVWRHKVVVIKGQKSMLPIKQWELVVRSDVSFLLDSVGKREGLEELS